MKLAELFRNTGIDCRTESEKNIEITGISYDSRHTRPGDLFVCIRGFQSDGHDFAEAAAKAGAAAVIAEKIPEKTGEVPVFLTENSRKALSAVSANFFGHPSDDMLVFGVTGTNGKTTISYLLKSIVNAWGKECGVLGTIAYVYGGQSFESVNTTPESFELQRMFDEMHRRYDTDVCAMEVSSHSLALSRTDDISFDYSIFTNLTEDHLDFHRDFEDYYAAKKKLFLQTSEGNVINVDDIYGRRLFRELQSEGKSVKSCGIGKDDAEKENIWYRAEILEKSANGTKARFFEGGKLLGELNIRTPGTFSVENAVGAAGAALMAGIPWEAVKKGIESSRGVAGRFESVENSRGIPVIVDYAHTPDALENVLKTAREFTEKRIITVFGCGGDRDRSKRPLMGEAAGKYSDYCVVTSDNPRTEDPDAILEDILPGVKATGCEYAVIEDRRRAIKKALTEYRPGDVVIIAGKGHEDYQIIGTVKQHFDDRETALQIIEQEI